MLYLRFIVTRPDPTESDREITSTAHLMFVSENVRMCTAEALALLRQQQCRGLQLKEARIGEAVDEFVSDDLLFRLARQAAKTGVAHEIVEGTPDVENLIVIRPYTATAEA